MRHKRQKDTVKKDYLKYILVDKENQTASIYHYKTQITDITGISTRTLDRKMPYQNDKWAVYRTKTIQI